MIGPRYAKRSAAPHRRTSLWVVAGAMFIALSGLGVALGIALRDDAPGSSLFSVDDGFDRTGAAGLGTIDGRAWEAVSGRFELDDGRAVLRTRNAAGPRSVAVTEVSATNGTVSVTAGSLTAGWGLVFRYVGPFNYWYVQAVPQYAVLNVVRVVDGEASVVGTTRLVHLEDGMTVQVVLRGPAIEVRVGDRALFATSSSHALGARKAGLISVGRAAGASWERFRFEPDRTSPGPKAVTLSNGADGDPSGAADAG